MSEFTRGSFRSGLAIVIFGFSAIAVVNLLTLLEPSTVLATYFEENHPLGILLSFSVFDSWGTIIGLVGVVPLFVPILIGTEDSRKIWLSTFFVAASFGLGIIASAAWDVLHEAGGSSFAYGSSATAIVALSIIFSESCILLTRILQVTKGPYARIKSALVIVYLTLVLTSLWFVLFIQPIFVPSNQYNWQVHELGFGLGVISTPVFEYLTSSRFRESPRRVKPNIL